MVEMGGTRGLPTHSQKVPQDLAFWHSMGILSKGKGGMPYGKICISYIE